MMLSALVVAAVVWTAAPGRADDAVAADVHAALAAIRSGLDADRPARVTGGLVALSRLGVRDETGIAEEAGLRARLMSRGTLPKAAEAPNDPRFVLTLGGGAASEPSVTASTGPVWVLDAETSCPTLYPGVARCEAGGDVPAGALTLRRAER